MRLTKERLREEVRAAIREAGDGMSPSEGNEDKKNVIKGDKSEGDYNQIKMDALYLQGIIKQELKAFLKQYQKLARSRPRSVGCSYADVINFVRTYEKASKGK